MAMIPFLTLETLEQSSAVTLVRAGTEIPLLFAIQLAEDQMGAVAVCVCV